jgi:hypothetical protein
MLQVVDWLSQMQVCQQSIVDPLQMLGAINNKQTVSVLFCSSTS